MSYSDTKAFELIKKIIGLNQEQSWLYFFGDCAYEEDETLDGNPAVYFQIPSRRGTFDFGGKYGVLKIRQFAAGYYDLVKEKVVLVQIMADDPDEYYDDCIDLDVEWNISQLRRFLGWYGVDINALNWLHKDYRNLKNAIKNKNRMYPHIVEDIKTRRWLELFKNEKIPKNEMDELHKNLMEDISELDPEGDKDE